MIGASGSGTTTLARALAVRWAVMSDLSDMQPLAVQVGGLGRSGLLSSLSSNEIHLNEHARTLLASDAFDDQTGRRILVAARSVAELGFPGGASLSRIFEVANQRGLLLCPPNTGPYLRLAIRTQTASSNDAMSSGRAPEGSLTVASAPLSEDDDYPKGFYLRVVGGQSWLRGYCCDDQYQWSSGDRFVFQI